jgi:hypothetical protein
MLNGVHFPHIHLLKLHFPNTTPPLQIFNVNHYPPATILVFKIKTSQEIKTKFHNTHEKWTTNQALKTYKTQQTNLNIFNINIFP